MRRTGWIWWGMLLVAGCGSAIANGSVVMRVSDTQAHIRMLGNTITPGDRVRVVRNVCTPSGRSQVCRNVVVGQGRVTQILSEQYSIVDFPSGADFKEGDRVEKVE